MEATGKQCATMREDRAAKRTDSVKRLSGIGAFWKPVALFLLWLGAPLYAQEAVKLDGSKEMLPFVRVLADEYLRRFPGRGIAVGIGVEENEGVRAIAQRQIHVAFFGRRIDPRQLEANLVNITPVATGAVVFAVNANSAIEDISETQLCNLYGGKLQSWRPLGGYEESVTVLTRPGGATEYQTVRSKIGCFQNLRETGAVVTALWPSQMVSMIAETLDAIGMTTIAAMLERPGECRALSLNGVTPTEDNIRHQRYGLTHDYFAVTRVVLEEPARHFLQFLESAEGQYAVREAGAIPVRLN